ncbi:hypothetical protein Lal_00037765 [Lupinus albus]|nr:hypothetical protein Lal_00037765 [Lupinus albus]
MKIVPYRPVRLENWRIGTLTGTARLLYQTRKKIGRFWFKPKYMASNEPELPTSQEASTENHSTSSYRRKSDPTWAHCKQVAADNGRTILICLFCMKHIKGVTSLDLKLIWRESKDKLKSVRKYSQIFNIRSRNQLMK